MAVVLHGVTRGGKCGRSVRGRGSTIEIGCEIADLTDDEFPNEVRQDFPVMCILPNETQIGACLHCFAPVWWSVGDQAWHDFNWPVIAPGGDSWWTGKAMDRSDPGVELF